MRMIGPFHRLPFPFFQSIPSQKKSTNSPANYGLCAKSNNPHLGLLFNLNFPNPLLLF